MPKQSSDPVTQAKRSRTSGKHSKNGCETCKIRRVKCDETRPTCVRCKNFKIACDGYKRMPGTAECKVPARRLSLATKASTSSASSTPSVQSISSGPSISFIQNAEEHQYFRFFEEHVLFEITQSAQASTFRRLILQASNIPSIHCTMIALSALAQVHYIVERERSHPLSTIDFHRIKIHRDYSLRQYAKGLSLMKQAMAAGHQDLRVTILTCLLIVCIECLHGNFDMASTQVSNGMALLREWRKGYPNANEHPIGLSSPAPLVLEDSLVQMLGGLEIQIPSYSGDIPRNANAKGEDEAHSFMIRNMPERFESFEESRTYLELLIKQSKPLFTFPKVRHSRSLSMPLSSVPSGQFHLQYGETSNVDYSHLSPIHRTPNNTPGPYEDGAIKSPHQPHLEGFHRGRASWDSLTSNNPTISSHPIYKDQLLSAKIAILVLTTVIPSNSTIPSTYEDTMTEILNLAEAISRDENESRDGTTFTIYKRLTKSPESVGLHCKMGIVPHQGTRLMNSLPSDRRAVSREVFMNAVLRWMMGFGEDAVEDGDSGGQVGDYWGTSVRKGSESSVWSEESGLEECAYDYVGV